ncbi:MAG: hypothetical protein JWO03_4122 [Bacteroidetes bacterium]|nr:hypothetical protein [Bacteroidota bacterium]
MKKLNYGILIAGILLIASCSKDNTTNNNNNTTAPNGTWSFKSQTYNAAHSINDGHGQFYAFDSMINGLEVNGVEIDFLSSNGASGPYPVLNYRSGLPPGNCVLVTMVKTVGGGKTTYRSTGGDGNQVANVTFTNGKITAIGSSIEMVNEANTSDSAALTFNVHEN